MHVVDAKGTRVTTLQVSHVMGSKYTHKLTHADTQTQTHRNTYTQTHRHTETQKHRHRDTETQRHRDTETQTPFKGLLGPSDHTNDHEVLKPVERYPSSILGGPPRPRLVVSICTFVPSKLGGVLWGDLPATRQK